MMEDDQRLLEQGWPNVVRNIFPINKSDGTQTHLKFGPYRSQEEAAAALEDDRRKAIALGWKEPKPIKGLNLGWLSGLFA